MTRARRGRGRGRPADRGRDRVDDDGPARSRPRGDRQHPRQRHARAAASPGRSGAGSSAARWSAKSAVEEMLRWDSPLQLFERWVLETGVEIAGQPMEVGDEVAMLFGSADRDHAALRPTRTTSTSAATTPPTSASAAASTSASAHRSPAQELEVSLVDLRPLPRPAARRGADVPPDVRVAGPSRATAVEQLNVMMPATPPTRRRGGPVHERRVRSRLRSMSP